MTTRVNNDVSSVYSLCFYTTLQIAKAIADRKVLEETSCRLKRMVADKDSFLGSLKDSRNESHDVSYVRFSPTSQASHPLTHTHISSAS